MTEHWAFKYLARPWVADKDPGGREKYDCWDHVRTVEAEQFKRDVQEINPGAYDIRTLMKILRDTDELENWKKTDKPQEGDVVQLGHAKRPHHVGVWVDVDGGRVLHCLEGIGVVAQSLMSLRTSGWGHITYWTPKK